ncbi:DsbA family protein [Magnetococcales bacterium HHB-1]
MVALNKKAFLAKTGAVLLGMFLLISSLPLAASDNLVAGEDYIEVADRFPDDLPKDRPEILEIFNFKCPHCYHLHGPLEAWQKKNSHQYRFRALPLFWGRQSDLPARAYYAARYEGKGPEMLNALFDMQFGSGSGDIENRDDLFFLLDDLGLDEKKFSQRLSSFGIKHLVQKAQSEAERYGINFTPAIVINRRYMVSMTQAKGDNKRLFELIEILAKRKE